jgi:hypothetical protein
MPSLKKIFIGFLTVLALLIVPAGSALANNGLLPSPDGTYANCDPSSADWGEYWGDLFEQDPNTIKAELDTTTKAGIQAILGCALKSGEIQFWMVPYYVIFIIEFLIELMGLLVVGMIVVGAYFYVIGGVTEDKEKGKTIISYALGGFVLVLSSWIITNIILLALTS